MTYQYSEDIIKDIVIKASALHFFKCSKTLKLGSLVLLLQQKQFWLNRGNKLMKRISMIIICTFFFLTLPGCNSSSGNAASQNEMPDIVFLYGYYGRDYYQNDIWLIDKEGNVYNNIGDESKNVSTIEEEYQTIQSNEKWTLVKQISLNELRIKYDVLKAISISKQNIIHDVEYSDDVVDGYKDWWGNCYDKKGNIISVDLYANGDLGHYNEDTRAEELVDWMCDIMGIEKNDFPYTPRILE